MPKAPVPAPATPLSPPPKLPRLPSAHPLLTQLPPGRRHAQVDQLVLVGELVIVDMGGEIVNVVNERRPNLGRRDPKKIISVLGNTLFARNLFCICFCALFGCAMVFDGAVNFNYEPIIDEQVRSIVRRKAWIFAGGTKNRLRVHSQLG